MKTITTHLLSLLLTLFITNTAVAQAVHTKSKPSTPALQTFLIEREIPGAGQMTPEQLKSVSQKSCTVLKEMGPGIEWIQSYVTGNKIYCIYRAENEEKIREHGNKGGFPVTAIVPIANQISPATAKQ